MKPISEKEALRNMIVEEQDKVTTLKIVEKIYNRQNLTGKGSETTLKLLGEAQSAIKAGKYRILDLIEMWKDASDDTPLEKELGIK